MKIFIGKYNSCGVNYQYFEIIHRLMEREDCQLIKEPEEADVIIFSTSCACHVDRIFYTLSYIESILNVKKPSARTYLTGCLAREYLDPVVFSNLSNWIHTRIDCVIPYNQTDQLLSDLFQESIDSDSSFGYARLMNGTLDLYISSGCLHQCSFCKTNYQKTPLVSMDFSRVKEIIDYADQKNIKTLSFRGMNVCQFGLDKEKKYLLPEVIDYTERKDHIERVNLIGFAFSDAIHHDFKYSLRASKKVDWIGGSFESGEDRILELMDKGFTAQEFLEFNQYISQDSLKKLRSNMIAGFPTETMEDVKTTIQALSKLKPYLDLVTVCHYKDSPFVKAHSLEQLSKEEIHEHARVYAKFLRYEKIPYRLEKVQK